MRVVDWLSRKHAWRWYQAYRSSQWFTPAEMEHFRVAKLRRLLQHCVRHVPFYRRVIEERRIDVERFSSLDVLQEFPIIDKATVKANYDEFVSTTRSGLTPLRVSQTGGTTGEPLRVIKDVGVRSSTQGALYRFYDWMSVGFGDPKILVWGAPIVRPAWQKAARERLLRRITNTTSLNAFRVSQTPIRDLIGLFRDRRPVLLHGYCLAIYELARRFETTTHRFALRAVSTTVEPLFEEYRSTLRDVFGCEAFDQYGCGEVEAIAMECGAHDGLHVTEERVIVELGDDGRVIVTDLDNHAFPLIRYRNGDLAVPGETGCACRRSGQKLQRILGRIGDVINGPNGNRVHPEFFTHLINETGVAHRRKLRKYQVIQEGDGHLEWSLVCEPLDDRDRELLIARLGEYLGQVRVDLRVVEDIPTARSGKFQYVVRRP